MSLARRALLGVGLGVGLAVLGAALPAAAETGPTQVPLADPDTYTGDPNYVTYGTSLRNKGDCGEPVNFPRMVWVPMVVRHDGAGGPNLTAACLYPGADAMPSGPGPWADASREIWAPSVIRDPADAGRFLLFYTATRAGTVGDPRNPADVGQRCIGRAVSSSPKGPFSQQTEIICPGAGRWAIDPDAFVHQGTMYLAYRDDFAARGGETALAVVRLDRDGFPLFGAPGGYATVLRSNQVNWDDFTPFGELPRDVVENPAVLPQTNGRFLLFFSGNNFNSEAYATGLASCSGPLGPCSLVGPDPANRPYFGHDDSIGPLPQPYQRLPRNLTGPGGMSPFRLRDGTAAVTWHYRNSFIFDLGNRFALTGVLSSNGGTFFSVS